MAGRFDSWSFLKDKFVRVYYNDTNSTVSFKTGYIKEMDDNRMILSTDHNDIVLITKHIVRIEKGVI